MKKIIFLLFIPVMLSFSLSAQEGRAPRWFLAGDSHSAGLFGQYFFQYVKEKKYPITVHGISSANLGWFYSGHKGKSGSFLASFDGQKITEKRTPKNLVTPLLETTLKEKKPDILVIAHGSNYLAGGKINKKGLLKHMQLLAASLRGSDIHCYWVTPPDMRRFHAMLPAVRDFIQEHSPCRVIDSLRLTSYPASGGDGVHYRRNFQNDQKQIIAQEWAKYIVELIEVDLRMQGKW